MTKRMIIMLASLGVLFGGIFGFQTFKAKMIKKYMGANRFQAMTITAMKADLQPWQPALKSIGTLRAAKGVDVSSEIAGQVRIVAVKSGQDVKKDDLLVQLNADPDVALLHSLQASADLADSVYQRDKQQFSAQAISQAQLDVDAADLKAKRAQAEEQRAVVAKKTISAPFSGHLGISTIQPGQYINAGDKIVTLQDLDPVYVDFSLPERDVARLKKGQKVIVTSDSFAGSRYEGRISTIDPKVDAATRNVQVEALIPNPRHQLLPGMYASVEIDAGVTENYITLPQTAVSFNPYGATAFIVDEQEKDGKKMLVARQSFIKTGPTRGDQVAILSGIRQGEMVVTSGQLKLRNGASVKIDNRISPSNDPAPKPVDE